MGREVVDGAEAVAVVEADGVGVREELERAVVGGLIDVDGTGIEVVLLVAVLAAADGCKVH